MERVQGAVPDSGMIVKLVRALVTVQSGERLWQRLETDDSAGSGAAQGGSFAGFAPTSTTVVLRGRDNASSRTVKWAAVSGGEVM